MKESKIKKERIRLMHIEEKKIALTNRWVGEISGNGSKSRSAK